MTIKLYELVGEDESRSFSPYVWRIRMALAHKGLPYESVPWRFTEKDRIAFSGQDKVPVLVDGDKTVVDSWAIAEYLDEAYPDRPALFDGPSGKQFARFTQNWLERSVFPNLAPIIVKDVWEHLHDKDKDYFKTTREKRFGKSLDELAANRETYIPQLRKAMEPLRATLGSTPYLSGDAPAYPDYIVFAALHWAFCISPCRLFEADDAVSEWRGRMMDLFDGLGRNATGYPEAA